MRSMQRVAGFLVGAVVSGALLLGAASLAVADQKGKAVELEAADAGLPFGPARRCDHDRFDGVLRRGNKFASQVGALSLVITGGGNQIGLKLGMIPPVHPSAARALRKTSSWVLG